MIVIRTETWTTKQGLIVKAVARDERGRLFGATNATRNIDVSELLVGIK